MKKKLIITSSLITILLALFPVSLYAEEVVQDPAPASTSDPGVLLDSYFYQNYDILPYIEATGTQYINTGIDAKSDLRINVKVSDFVSNDTNYHFVFGANSEIRFGYRTQNSEYFRFSYNLNELYQEYDFQPYVVYYVGMDDYKVYLNNNNILNFTETDFTSSTKITIFNDNPSESNGIASCKLYSFSIYDYDADSGNGAYVRYFYPAKAKSGGTIGLYDAVSKTFFPSLGTDPFGNPTDDKVLNFQITDFITAGLTWIGDILDFVIATPIILFFLAIGLAGAMYRWARRIVHF